MNILLVTSPSLMISRRWKLGTMTFWCHTTFLHCLPTYLWTSRFEPLREKPSKTIGSIKSTTLILLKQSWQNCWKFRLKTSCFNFKGFSTNSRHGFSTWTADGERLHVQHRRTSNKPKQDAHALYTLRWRYSQHNAWCPSCFTFLSTLNEIHSSISFTMELEENGKPPFLGMEIIRNSTRLDRKVYRKPTDTGLLLHLYSHVDMKYKHSLLKTMLNHAFKLSSNWQFFHQECERLKEIFTRLQYPEPLIQNTIRFFVEMKATGSKRPPQQAGEIPVRIPLPFKDQRSANKLLEQLRGRFSRKINTEAHSVYQRWG